LRQPLACLAGLLDRPNPRLRACARDCRQRLQHWHPELARKLYAFASWLDRTSWFEIEDIYRATLELGGWCPAGIAGHLFPPARRAPFLVRLESHYRLHGFSPGGELPDHIAVVLRFAAAHPHAPEGDRMVEFCVRPALRRMRARLGTTHPYAAALDAMILYFALEEKLRGEVKGSWPAARPEPWLLAAAG
jgi:nitrate reductase delta subunit